MQSCPLCGEHSDFKEVQGPGNRDFHLCGNCYLIFTSPQFQPTLKEEEARYLTHNNGIEHKGYVAFLNRALLPALEFIYPGMTGLDFGCGPVPTLSKLLEKEDIQCHDYDPIFFSDLDKQKRYDFIFATECFEHFFHPAKELWQIKQLLKDDGILIIMTELWKNEDMFKNWYYARDPTHVSFYNERTLKFIAERFEMDFLYNDKERVFILKRKSTVSTTRSVIEKKVNK